MASCVDDFGVNPKMYDSGGGVVATHDPADLKLLRGHPNVAVAAV